MTKRNLHIIKNIVTAIVVTLFFSCKNDFDEVQKIGVLQNQPIGEAENIDLKYTETKEDTAVRLVANLLSPKMLDYSNRDFAFSEFPNGIELIVYDEDNNKTTITSRYAIYYTETGIIDLRDEVVVATYSGDTLRTHQLFYNEKLEWVFTNKRFTFKGPTTQTYGYGFDSDKTFKKYQIHEMGGDFELDN
ncbi:LPS export ABC transporter periplasmic protein LptC [Winogradskyella echinorum]|uniref:LPS export ABC transporter periplasmic protein LptC n=1 Tax=Winogradskyella echinorum TaxID=538189 RepID=A0ABR6XZ18_9FLAO|nr:LPS export ABC transporter periplasmic protein LptC [Winogradskyella echinorum]MBC3845223.1 LPS export ABC transporter periplasmic protein LptC [Winogradskyella echinorum]MBC5749571.1 LPS export ABC transporter periplasmic protein LptC [Winogradskyella echinorum]